MMPAKSVKQSQSPQAQAVAKVQALYTRDPRKFLILTVLAVIMLGLWGKMFFGGPPGATASLVRRAVNGISPFSGPVQSAAPARSRSGSGSALLKWLESPKTVVARNLFAVNLDYYPREQNASGNTGAEDPAKSASAEADQMKERQALTDAMKAHAAALHLQSTMLGATRKALVDGQLLEVGDTVEGFSVVDIQPRRVVLEQDGERVELNMDKTPD